MHFGLPKKNNRFFILVATWITFSLCLNAGCKEKDETIISFKSPEQGQNICLGDVLTIGLEMPKDKVVESVTYLVDGKEVMNSKNANPVSIPTKGWSLGYRMLSAVISSEGKKDTITTNIVLKTNIAPIKLNYNLVKSYPHDTSAYTEGLAYIDGKLLESTGEMGASLLKWVELATGKTIQSTKLDPQYFGEGSLKIGDKIIMLTWRENIGFIFDAKTFKQLGTFPYQNSREGWGLAFDGKRILRSDGSNRIWWMNANTYKEEGYIEVYDNNGPVDSLNELEYIDGKIYANVYETTKIVRIDPASGAVEAEIDLSALVPKNFFKTPDEEQNNVLNGIAWDAKGKRLFVAGKKWPKLYEIKLAN